MRIKITRTSVWDDEDKPCNDKRLKKDTYLSDNGKKHTGWFIDINNLEELFEFIDNQCRYNQCSEVVIGKIWRTINEWELEIYDDYRE
jgi:hypothetical protein